MADQSVRKQLIQAPAHPEYESAAKELKKVRDCMEGGPKVKAERYEYLPHPSQIDSHSLEQQIRYKEYLAGAEFDGYPDLTRRSLLGKMRLSDTEIDIPPQVDYLIDNADGDGLALTGAIEHTASSVMQMKFHLLVADYQGLSDVDLESLSLADVEQLNPRATIKQYSRENVVNWHFDRRNGVMQLSWVMLLERGFKFDPKTREHEPIESYLILALDDNGDYYQQKVVYDDKGEKDEGDPEYLTVSGQRLKWLPVVVVGDEQIPPNRLPRGMGFLHAICEASLDRYRVSAVYKEVQKNLPPTTYTSGWKAGDVEVFKEANGGRSYVATGAGVVNNMPEGVTTDIISASMDMEDFHWYDERAEQRAQRLGGNKDSEVNKTATEAKIIAADQNAMLESVADSIESGYKRVIAYCAMFEGAANPDSIEDALTEYVVSLPRDFASPRLTVEEVRAVMDMRMNRQISEGEFHRQIKTGGWMISEVEEMIEELNNEGPVLIPANDSVNQQEGSA